MQSYHYRHLLSLAVGHLASSSKSIEEIYSNSAKPLQAALSTLACYGTGRIFHIGALPDDMALDLASLKVMSRNARSTGGRIDHCGMSLANDAAIMWLSSRLEVLSAILRFPVEIEAIAKPVFVYYENEGDLTHPHLDEQALIATIVVCIRHRTTANRSVFRFFTSEGIQRVRLEEGECVIFEGSKIPHGCEPMHEAEGMEVMTIGLRESL